MLRKAWSFGALSLLCSVATSSAAVVVHSDDFSTDTRADYTNLGIYYSTDRVSTDWVVASGMLDVVGGRNGMLAIEDSGGGLLATPDHFSISYSFDPTGVDDQDHPSIVFGRTATNARLFYLRSHTDEAVVGYTTSGGGISLTSKALGDVLTLGTSYDLTFEVDYLTQTASVTVYPYGGGAAVTSATFSGTDFTNNFGTTNTGGAFGLVGFDTERALIDNLFVTDFTQVPEPSGLALLGLSISALMVRSRRRPRC